MAAPRKDNVQKLIIETTEKLLETQKLSDIPFSYHYKSKNDILFDIMDKYLSKQFNDLLTWTENPNKDTSLHRLVKYVLERDISNANMRLHFFYDAMLGNEEVRVKLLKRYEDFAKIISEKIEERTSIMSADYLAWLLLLLSDGLFIHKTLNNENLDVTKFITQSEELMKMFSNSISDFDSK